MAESDHRWYRDSADAPTPERPRAQADDPLAELARLIGQSVPMNKLGRDRRPTAPESADDRRGQTDRAASYPAPEEVLPPPTDDLYSTPEDEQYERDIDPDYRERSDERYEPTARENLALPSRGSRFRQEPDFAMEPARDGADGDETAHQETADWHDQSSDGSDSRHPDEYENERHDADDHGYGDEYSEDQNTGPQRFHFCCGCICLGRARHRRRFRLPRHVRRSSAASPAADHQGRGRSEQDHTERRSLARRHRP